ncbi:SDR family oxidoreductase [Millisia brevis]|uniref:SDR family oxidoreductase n=1 Tax=Millisia brevis TaxID=264148 RepID=UPI0008309CE9|nr:SDR family oxidoreductase [Millisia brevis]
MSTETQATATARHIAWRPRTVEHDGISIAVFEAGTPGKTPLLLMHGWPDTHELWTAAAADLVDRFHLIAYDTRGYGGTTRPRSVDRYRLPQLAGDMFAVVRATSPDRPVHVLAHDWGSVQAWEAVTTEGADRYIASFVSISGPNLDHLGAWVRERLSRPTPASLRAAFSQLASSAYTGLFQLPVLPVLATKVLALPGVWPRFINLIEGTPTSDVVTGATFRADTTAGLAYYRANIRPALARPDARPTDIPVLEVVNHRDIALRPPIFDNSRRYATNLWRIDTANGHWLPFSRPEFIADITTRFIASLEGTPDPEIDRLRVTEAPGSFTGRLAVITGAGSGIGRETALALAERGAELALADIDIAAAKTVADTIDAAGGRARAYQLDVADDEAFAETVAAIIAAQGVPDIVVNNAGVALAGSILDATDAQIRRLIDINLTGVITGSRLFGKAMVERGVGGHIVNLASAAAFTPQRGLGAYAATKAGVLLFSESLRAELADDHIGVTAICPGIVATNITSSTRIAGADAETERAQQERITAAYRRRNYTPDRVAKAIVRSIEKNRAVVPVTPEAQAGYRTYRFTPAVSRALARVRVV